MSDLIDFVEDAADLDWFSCPVLSRGAMLVAIGRRKELDGRAINLFENALTLRPHQNCWTAISRRISTIPARITSTQRPTLSATGSRTGIRR